MLSRRGSVGRRVAGFGFFGFCSGAEVIEEFEGGRAFRSEESGRRRRNFRVLG